MGVDACANREWVDRNRGLKMPYRSCGRIARSALMPVVVLVLASACGIGESVVSTAGSSAKQVPSPNLTEFGTSRSGTVNAAGDVAISLAFAPGDHVQGVRSAGVVIAPAGRSPVLVPMKAPLSPVAVGAVGGAFVVVAAPCSTPSDEEQDCQEASRAPSAAFLVDGSGAMTEIAVPAAYPGVPIGTSGDTATFLADGRITVFDKTSGAWSTKDAAAIGKQSIVKLNCPAHNLAVVQSYEALGGGVLTPASTGTTILAVGPDSLATAVVVDGTSKGSSEMTPVACGDGVVVFDNGSAFISVGLNGLETSSTPHPDNQQHCRPLDAATAAASCGHWDSDGLQTGTDVWDDVDTDKPRRIAQLPADAAASALVVVSDGTTMIFDRSTGKFGGI